MTDYLDMFDEEEVAEQEKISEEDPKKQEPASEDSNSWKKKGNDSWEAIFDPIIINKDELVRNTKRYLISGSTDAPSEFVDKAKAIAASLLRMGYVVRTNINGDRDKINSIATFEAGDKVEGFLPWAGFGTDNSVKKHVIVKAPSKEAYGIATANNKVYNTLKPVVRAFVARDTHLILGKDLKTPIDFLICYSDDGAETNRELSSKTGSVGYLIKLCNECNIPVFNMRKDGSINERFKSFIKSIN